jgi:hypothetical protein
VSRPRGPFRFSRLPKRFKRPKKSKAHCKVLGYNICIVHQSDVELGIEPVFWPEHPAGKKDVPAVLPMVRPE